MKSNIKKLFHFTIFFVLTTLSVYFLIATPKFNLEIFSNVTTNAQLFYKISETSPYSEQSSYTTKIKNTFQVLKISLPSYSETMRLDIANEEYKITIHKMYVSLMFLDFPIDSFENAVQIDKLNYANNEITIETINGATDPQLFFKIDKKKIDNQRILLSLFFGLFTAVFLFLFSYSSKLSSVFDNIDSLLSSFYSQKIKPNFSLSEFGIYFAIALAFHIFEASNFLISIDDEGSAFRTLPEAWVWDGRWTGYLIERFIFDQPTMPFVPNLIFCAFMALSYIIILKSHKIERNWKVFILFPIYAAFPTLWTINEFYGNMTMVGVGFFLVSLSTLMFIKTAELFSTKKFSISKLKGLFFSSLLLAIAIGAYQSFIMLALASTLGILILQTINNDKMNGSIPKFKYFLFTSIYLISSLFIYVIINIGFKFIFPSERKYIDGFINIFGMDYLRVIKFVFQEMSNLYSGSSTFFGVSIGSIGILFIFIFIIFIIQKTNKLSLLGLFFTLLISPFLLHFLSGGNALPTRSMVAVPYVVWIIAYIAINNKRISTNAIGITIVSVLIIQMLSTLGQYAAATYIGQVHDKMMAHDLYRRMADANQNFNRNKISLVDVYGYKSIETVYPSVPTSTISASFFDWDGGNAGRMITYMKLLGYVNIKNIDTKIFGDNNQEFHKMPSWPNKGCVKYINGIYLIKLSTTPDPHHK